MDKPVYVTRFNNETFNQNRRYCETYDGKECIYNTPVVFNNKTRENNHIYVLEMNNSINKINSDQEKKLKDYINENPNWINTYLQISTSGKISKKPFSIAFAAAEDVKVSLKESGAINIFISYFFDLIIFFAPPLK